MTKMKPTVIAAFIAGLSISGVAFAADPATPGKAGAAAADKAEMTKPAGAAGDKAAADKGAAGDKAAADKGAAGPAGADSSSGGATGNTHWAKIDKDNDNSVTPEEMEAFLAGTPGGKAGGGSSAAKDAPKDTSSAAKEDAPKGAAGPAGEEKTKLPAQVEGKPDAQSGESQKK